MLIGPASIFIFAGVGSGVLDGLQTRVSWGHSWIPSTFLIPLRAGPFECNLAALGAMAAIVLLSAAIVAWRWKDSRELRSANGVLREGNHLFQVLLESTPDYIYFKDLDSRFVRISRAHAGVFSLNAPSDAIGKTDEDFFATEHASEALADEREIIRTGTAMIGKQEKETWPDGSETWVSTSKMPLRDLRGHIVGTFGISRDITRRKLAEDALLTMHRELEQFFNSVAAILVGLDMEGRVTRCNSAAAAAFGLSEEGVRGKKLDDCGIRWLGSGMDAEIRSWWKVDSIPSKELMFEKGGELRSLNITVQKVFNLANGKAAGLLITALDTTERRALEVQLRQAQKLEAIGQLAAGIAHEINTPIQFVGDNAMFLNESWVRMREMIRSAQVLRLETEAGPATPAMIAAFDQACEAADIEYLLQEIPRAIEQSLEGVQRVAKIVRALKDFSHPGSEERCPIDVNRAIETTITVARNEWKYVADVQTSLDRALPLVPCFAGEFNQVMLNLLVNAAQAIAEVVKDGPGKGTITVATKRDGNWLEIRVQDTGPGIPESLRLRVFEPFFTTKDVGTGSGQGLALAHSVVVKKHGGRIWFDSQGGVGTTFYVRLPLAPLEESGQLP